MARKGIFRGWFIVAGAFCVLALNYGTRYAFGVFLPTLAAEHGWNPLFLSIAAGLNIMVYASGSVVTGHFSDSIPPRWLVTSGALLLSACFLLLPFMRNPYAFCFVYGIIGGFGAAGMGVVVCSSSVGKWFVKKRGIATGIATMGIGVGTAIIVPLAGVLEAELGWSKALFSMGALVMIIGVAPAQALLRYAYPEDIGLNPDGSATKDAAALNSNNAERGRALKLPFHFICQKQFIIISLSFALAVMALMTVFIHGVAYAISCGIEKRLAALAIGLLSLSGLAGQVFFGWVSDRLRHPRNASVVGFFLMAVGIMILLTVHNFHTFVVFAIVFGFGYGSLAPLAPILVARIFGRKRMGAIHGLVTLFLGGGGAVGPIATSLVLRTTGSYDVVWFLMIFALLASSVLIRFLNDDSGY